MESEKRRLKIIWQEQGENELSLLFVETASIKFVFPCELKVLYVLAPFQINNKSLQTARNNFWNWKISEIVKTQKCSKLKIFTN